MWAGGGLACPRSEHVDGQAELRKGTEKKEKLNTQRMCGKVMENV